MKRFGRLSVAMALVATLGLVSACQRTVEVQTGTRVVDSQGRVISEDIHTLRVPPETAGAYRVETTVQEDAASAQLASLYTDAQTAIAKGNLKLAAKKLAEIITISPTYRNAQAQAAAIKSGKKPPAAVKPSSPSTSTTPPAKPPISPSSALVKWLPSTLVGFTAAKAIVDPMSVSREYIPGSGNPAKSLVIVAEQFRNSADAKRGLAVNVKQRYTKNVSYSTVHGHAVYFGTDGDRFAVIGFTSGAVMVALEASPDSGSPTTMKQVLEKALRQLP